MTKKDIQKLADDYTELNEKEIKISKIIEKKGELLPQGISRDIASKSLEKGVKIYGGKGAEPELMGDLIIISPPLVIESTQIDKIIEVVDETISSAEKEFL